MCNYIYIYQTSPLQKLTLHFTIFHPPNTTGKTLIGKAIAYESGATFFSISASSLMSKWTGESERLVKTLFAVASHREPSVVFIDEVDSLLTQRSAEENEASRRLKTEFLVQLDGAATPSDRVLIVSLSFPNLFVSFIVLLYTFLFLAPSLSRSPFLSLSRPPFLSSLSLYLSLSLSPYIFIHKYVICNTLLSHMF